MGRGAFPRRRAREGARRGEGCDAQALCPLPLRSGKGPAAEGMRWPGRLKPVFGKSAGRKPGRQDSRGLAVRVGTALGTQKPGD